MKILLFILSLAISYLTFSQKRMISQTIEMYDYLNPSIPYVIDSISYHYALGMGGLSEFDPGLVVSEGDFFYKYEFYQPKLEFSLKERYTRTVNTSFNLGSTETKTYDAMNQLLEHVYGQYRNVYTYFPNGGVSQMDVQHFISNTWTITERYQYQYDALGRVNEEKEYIDFGQGLNLYRTDSIWYDGNTTNCVRIKRFNAVSSTNLITDFVNGIPQSFELIAGAVLARSGVYYSSNGKVDSLFFYNAIGGVPEAEPMIGYFYEYDPAGNLIQDSLYHYVYNTIQFYQFSYDDDNYVTEFKIFRTNPVNESEVYNQRNEVYTYEDYNGIPEKKIDISFYPNPTDNELTVHTSDQLVSLVVYDMNGKKMLEQYGSPKIDVSSLASGDYRLVVFTERGVGEKGFIKQ